MTVEHRYSARHPIGIRVHIRYGRRRFCAAQARNLSLHGMFLTVHNLRLSPETPVVLEMECLGREWLLDAVVVHCSGSGVGVMFREPQPALYDGYTRGDIRGSELAVTPPPAYWLERPRLPRR